MSRQNLDPSAYYAWDRRPAQLITETELKLYRCCKRLFNESRQSLGSRQVMKNLRKEGFNIGRYKVMSLMRQLGLYVKQRTAEGWMYLSIIMDLYFRRIIGWSVNKRMTVDLVKNSM